MKKGYETRLIQGKSRRTLSRSYKHKHSHNVPEQGSQQRQISRPRDKSFWREWLEDPSET
jgi:hypothetical protein